ncbi:MAG TPA: DUF3050 domain-containing protein [Chitinophaga sp.]|uniref:DUF3050 domain-containing protein n=1 Tax=Chitinophaga sp. TaxID=1869181 RepID=UPI002C0786A2|nr:DUF3050 domain-containing protein [Chitinophaga sp.]HVI43737.1 DUF3050 domain-containing protein [Chitinophaga sp.]
MSTYNTELIREAIQPVRKALTAHPLYATMRSISDIRVFMKYHVFAVWDFMSLLKSLQLQLTCTDIPWIPKGSAATRFLINEIVTGEESDVDQNGQRVSHYELYLTAMEQAGASSEVIREYMHYLNNGYTVQTALVAVNAPAAVQQFVQYTFDVVQHEPVHVQAAVFTFGREDLIPDIFMPIVSDLDKQFPEQVSIFKYYLERHIEVDGDHHSLLGMEMVRELCGDDPKKWEEAIDAAKKGLEMRLVLWDGITSDMALHTN